MVRWVFRPYTQVRRQRFARQFRTTQASTKFSPGFTMSEHSSPSFGSQLICSLAWLFLRRQTSWQWRHTLKVQRMSIISLCCTGPNYRTQLAPVCFRYAAVNNEHIVILYDSQSSWTPWSVFQDGSDSCASFHSRRMK